MPMPKGRTGNPNGRPRGSKNKATAAQMEAVADSGLTPLDFLLCVLRDDSQDVRVRIEAARAAAPYAHKRMPVAAEQKTEGEGYMLVLNIAAPPEPPSKASTILATTPATPTDVSKKPASSPDKPAPFLSINFADPEGKYIRMTPPE